MNGFIEYPINNIGKDFVCGDIHGCYSDLEEELAKINFDITKDRLFCVGDLADRGPESNKSLEYIKKPWFHPVMGNHEDMFLQCWYYKSSDKYWHFSNGGQWCNEIDKRYIEEYGILLEQLPLIINIGKVLILHSLCPKFNTVDTLKEAIKIDNPYYQNIKEYILWERDKSYNHFISDINIVYAGHTIVKNPVKFGCVTDIDTGSFLKYWEGESGKITIVQI